jgi:hypothetical protein
MLNRQVVSMTVRESTLRRSRALSLLLAPVSVADMEMERPFTIGQLSPSRCAPASAGLARAMRAHTAERLMEVSASAVHERYHECRATRMGPQRPKAAACR